MNPIPMYTSESLLMMTSPVGTDSASANVSPTMDQAQIRCYLKHQVEYYFSRENLNHDTYLVSQMDADQYVDIAIIASFNQVKKLTSDINLVVEVMRESTNVQVDETGRKVRPLHKRSMIILREIPENTTKQELKEMLTHDDCPAFLSCEYASGNCWYIDFSTEEQAQKAYQYLRETVKTFKGGDIKARIKAKPSAVTMPLARPEPGRTDLALTMTNTTETITPPAMALPHQAIRYPVSLQHVPLHTPPFPFVTMQNPAPFNYMPSYVISPQILPPPWSGVIPADSNYQYDVNQGYSYSNLATQARPGSQNSLPSPRGNGRGAPCSNGMADRHESGHSITSPSMTPSVPSKGSASSHYYNSRNGSENSSYQKHNGVSHRGNRGYGDGHSSCERNNIDNVPPRLRNNAQRDRNHRDKRNIQGHGNHFGHSTPGQVSTGPNRRSVNQQAHQRLNVPETSSANSSGHLPHSHEHRFERNGGKDYTSRQPAANVSHAHRNHGAHRNSKSPEKEEAPAVHEMEQPQSFELDSSAFPALPGATSPTAVNAISSDSISTTSVISSTPSTATVSSFSQVPEISSIDAKNSSAGTGDFERSSKTDSVSKLSDIVKSNIPELSKIADATKSKPIATSKELDKSSHPSMSKGQMSSKSHAKSRPTHLTNGVHTDKTIHGKNMSKSSTSVSKSGEAESGKLADKSSPSSRHESGDLVVDTKSFAKVSASAQDSKISYASIAATANSSMKPTTQDQSPAPPPSPPSGDNNNNADSKSLPPKPDNLCYSTAAKTASNATAVHNSPRKSTSSQHYRNGPSKPKSIDSKTTPNSPTNRSTSNSQTAASSQAAAVLVAR